MIKFYVVDGISYPAAETAVGHFGGHGYECMRLCREVGISDASYKGSMEFDSLISFLNKMPFPVNASNINNLDIKPLDYYLKNHGFGVQASATELFMAQQYLVNGIPYKKIEELAKIYRRKGFEAMYAVCKFGGFYGAKNKRSMTSEEFTNRKKMLNLIHHNKRKYTQEGYLEEILGKTISKVVLRQRLTNDPHCQLYLEFGDGTNFEFYATSEMIKPTKGLMPCKVRELGSNEKAVDVVCVEQF